MLDINFIRDNQKKVKKATKDKGFNPKAVDEVLRFDENRRELIVRVEKLRQERNQLNQKLKKKRTDDLIENSLKLKKELNDIEPQLTKINDSLIDLMFQIPNLPADDVPIGKDERENKIISKWGKLNKFTFEPKDHLELGELLDVIDVKRAAKVSGTRFGYIKGDLVLLEFALVELALKTLIKEGFIPIIPPVLIKKDTMQGMGYIEHGGVDDMYVLDKDNLVMVGTAEQSIGPMHKDELLSGSDLPLRYVGFSTSFRREAGSYGKDTRGILRVHQFDKVEMFSYTLPQESDKEHDYLLSLEEKLFQKLKIPYQVVKMCTGDLGAPVARKFDLEAWLPGQDKYREVTSTSTTTDFQARRLNIKYQHQGKTDYVHTLNGTAFAIGRTLIAILENNQQKEGSVKIPTVLQPYLGKKVISPAKK